MNEQEYLQTVSDQIRYVKAKPLVETELRNHIADQKEAYIEAGIEESEALGKAVEEMGDPVEVGVAMDRVHRPKIEWGMLLLITGISMAGLAIQFAIKTEMGSEAFSYNFQLQCRNVMIGFAVMLLFCFLDYTLLASVGKIGAAAVIGMIAYSLLNDITFNGQAGWINGFHGTLSMHQFAYLYIPFYGSILYSYRNSGVKGFIKSCLWILLPLFFVNRMSDISLTMNLFFIMLIQMFFVIKKGWFQNVKHAMGMIVTSIIGIPVLTLSYFVFAGATYQRARILSFLTWDKNDMNYTLRNAREYLLESNLIGQSGTDMGEFLPGLSSDFIVTYVVSYYGILATIVLIAVLGIFIAKLFHISIRQKNQLGYVMGIGCSLVFAVQIIMYILVNLTLIPTVSVFLPLFTYGGSGTMVSFALLGIILSIYRYQSTMPNAPCLKLITVRNQKIS